MRSHLRKKIIAVLVALSIPLFLGSSCPSREAAPTKTIAFHPEPDDPIIAVITSQDGEAVLYGTKAADGTPTHVDSLAMNFQGTNYSVLFDELDRVTIASDDKGNISYFSYTDTTLLIEFTAPDGSQITETVPLDQIPNWPPTLTNARKIQQSRLQQSGAGSTKIFIDATVNLVRPNGERLKELTNAVVDVTIGTAPRQIAPYNAQVGTYRSILYHRAQPLTITRDECNNFATQGGRVATHAGTAVALMAVLCGIAGLLSAGTATPFCAFILGLQGALIGFSLGATSSTLTEVSLVCANPTVLAAADSPIYNLNFEVQHPSIQGGGQTFINQTANVTNLGSGAALAYTFDVTARDNYISTITTSPPAPGEFQDYNIIFEATAPGFTLVYTITGSDGFADGETLTAGIDATSVTSKTIPGGASGIKDTITAQLIEPFSGTVLFTKNASFTFR